MSDGPHPASSSPPQGAIPAPPPSPPSNDPGPATVLGLSRGDALFTLFIGGLILALTLLHWFRLTLHGAPPVEIDRLPASTYEFQVEINHATWVEWMQLEGIGEITARRIVADREERGPFADVDDLDRVAGIGPKTLAAIRPFLRCRDCDPPTGDSP